MDPVRNPSEERPVGKRFVILRASSGRILMKCPNGEHSSGGGVFVCIHHGVKHASPVISYYRLLLITFRSIVCCYPLANKLQTATA